MLIQGRQIKFDILAELEEHLDQFPMYAIRENKLMSRSPFRPDRKPSFAVNLDHGGFIDSGSTDPIFGKGNIIRLLAFLKNMSEYEVEQYLIAKYYRDFDTDKLVLRIDLDTKEQTVNLNDINSNYAYRHPYLEGRGISETVQQHFKVGYDRSIGCITMPWLDLEGNIVNIKYRNVSHKSFFFIQGGSHVSKHVYGLYHVVKYNCKEVVIVESEIDAMYLWTHKIPAIALGGSSISRTQVRLLLKSPVDTVILATDNDGQGSKAKAQLISELMPYYVVKELQIPPQYKDVNEVPSTELVKIYNNSKQCVQPILNIMYK